MSDPATASAHAAAAAESAAAAGVVITLTGSIFGLQFDAIMAGFVGALVAQTLVHDEIVSGESVITRYVRGFLQLCAAGLLAGLISPVAETILAGMLPAKVPTAALHIAVAGTLGMIAPVVVPALRSIAKRLAERP